MGMMSQIPLSYLSKYMCRYGPRWGNIVVWASIILGQPLAVMAYYHDYVITHYNEVIKNTEFWKKTKKNSKRRMENVMLYVAIHNEIYSSVKICHDI